MLLSLGAPLAFSALLLVIFGLVCLDRNVPEIPSLTTYRNMLSGIRLSPGLACAQDTTGWILITLFTLLLFSALSLRVYLRRTLPAKCPVNIALWGCERCEAALEALQELRCSLRVTYSAEVNSILPSIRRWRWRRRACSVVRMQSMHATGIRSCARNGCLMWQKLINLSVCGPGVQSRPYSASTLMQR